MSVVVALLLLLLLLTMMMMIMKSIRTFFDGESDPDDAVIAVAQNNTVQGRIANYMVIPAQDELFKIPRVGMGDSDPLYGVV